MSLSKTDYKKCRPKISQSRAQSTGPKQILQAAEFEAHDK